MSPTLFRDAARPPGSVDDRLDERVRVVSPRLWLGLVAALLVVAGILIWSIVTTIPVEVEGQAVVQSASGLDRVQAGVAGVVTEVPVGPGTMVRGGQVVARLRTSAGARAVTVRASAPGVVVAPTVRPGSVVAPESLIATIEPATGRLLAFVYVPAQQSGGVSAGQRVLLSPESSNAQADGLLEGRVAGVSAFAVPPERVVLIAGEALGRELTDDGPVVEVRVALEPAAEGRPGYRWTTGAAPAVRIAAGTLADASIVLGEERPIGRVF